jgi:hypothetical protein
MDTWTAIDVGETPLRVNEREGLRDWVLSVTTDVKGYGESKIWEFNRFIRLVRWKWAEISWCIELSQRERVTRFLAV